MSATSAASASPRARIKAWHRFREPAVRGAQLLAASGFALAQPLFDILGKNAEFFAVRGSTPSDIVLFALAVTFVPALVLLAIEVAVELVTRRDAAVLHYAFVAFLAAVFGVQALKRSDVEGTTVLIVGAAVIGLGIAAAAWRVAIVRSFLTILAGASLIFLGNFIFNSKVEELVFPAEVKAAVANVDASTPVVYLLFDEFPLIDLLKANEQVDARRFPNFARLAQTSIWFRNTTTLSASTTVAVPVILTGNPPVRGALPLAQNYPHNLFTLLASRYRMDVTESQTRLCPSQLCSRDEPSIGSRLSSLYSDARTVYLHLISPPKLEDGLPNIDESWGNFGSDAGDELVSETLPKVNMHTFYIGRVQDFNRFIASMHRPAGRKPTLYFLHILMPHGPWLYYPNGRVRAVANPKAPGRIHELWWSSSLAVQAWQRHLLQVGYTDKLIGRLVKQLESVGLWDKSLVLVGPDHGISFRGGDKRREPTRTNLSDLAFIPFFVKLPAQKTGRVVDTHITTEDILPTIADVLGVDVPWSTNGSSALKANADEPVVQVGKLKAPYRTLLAQRKRSLARMLRLFGSGDWGPRFAATGRYWRLVGRPVDSLTVAGTVDAQAVVDAVGSKLLRALPKNSPVVPSPVSGKFPGLRTGGMLALALNGRIAAAAPTYESGGKQRFSLMPSDAGFRAGRNEVRMFFVSGPVAGPTLREIPVTLSS